jgi:hypothetical protein
MGTLKMSHIGEPALLPVACGGIGMPAPFGKPANIYNYMRSYRGGEKHRIFGSAVEELGIAVNNALCGKTYDITLCQRIRENDEKLLHATYDKYIFVPKSSMKFEGDNGIPEIFYRSPGTGSLACAEARLIQNEVLIGE